MKRNSAMTRQAGLNVSLGLALMAIGSSAMAQTTEYGRVLSSTPVVALVPVTQRECVSEPVPRARSTTGGSGAVAGALFGAALGSMVGGGVGRAAATGIGMVAGAALGDHAEAQAAPTETATRCRDVARTEQRVVGYDVVYDYQGVQRTVRLPQAPGERIALEVNVVPAGAVVAPSPVPAPTPAYPVYPAQAPAPVPAYPAAVEPAPVYRAPGESSPYDAPPPAPTRVAVNPWPYVVAAGVGAVILSQWWNEPPRAGHRHGGRRGH